MKAKPEVLFTKIDPAKPWGKIDIEVFSKFDHSQKKSNVRQIDDIEERDERFDDYIEWTAKKIKKDKER